MIIGITGNPGAGKTLLLTAIGIDELDHGKTVYSTYHLTYKAKDGHMAQYVDFSKLGVWLQKGHKLPPNTGLLLLDEGYKGMDARQSRSLANIILSHFILQARKLGLDVYYTAQLFSTVDLRVRRNTEMGIRAVQLEVPENPEDENSPLVQQFYYQWQDFRTAQIKEFVIDNVFAKEIWQYFDSYEIVKSPLASLDKEAAKKMVADIKAEELKGWDKEALNLEETKGVE